MSCTMPGLGIDVPTLRSGPGSTVSGTITLYVNEGTDLRSITVRLVANARLGLPQKTTVAVPISILLAWKKRHSPALMCSTKGTVCPLL